MNKKLIKKQKNKYGPGSPYYEYIEQGLTPEQIDYILSQGNPASITQELLDRQVKANLFPTWEAYYKNIEQAKQERKDYMHNKGYDRFVYIDSPYQTYTDSEENSLITTLQNSYVFDQIDSRFNRLYDAGKLRLKDTPDTTVYGTPHVHLRVFPIGGRYLPGHIAATSPTPDGFVIVDRKSSSPNYSLLGNHNCASSVYLLLKDIFGNAFDSSTSAGGIWRPIDLPWNVGRLAKQLPGAKVRNKHDYEEIIIPISNKYTDRMKNIKDKKYYESL